MKTPKSKRIKKRACGIAAAVFVLLMLCAGRYMYITRYKTTDIASSASADNRYEVVFLNVGEPDFPFGSTHARIVLKQGKKTVSKQNVDILNDGKMLCAENWNVVWRENGAAVTLSGEEQEDAVYVFCFDGTVETE